MNIDLNAPATVYAQLPNTNLAELKNYIGSHLSTCTIKDEEYFGSCDDPHFRIHRSNGQLRKIILFTGTLGECRSIEHQLLVHYNAASNPRFYNSSNGGGYGVDKDYKPNPTDFQRMVDIIDGKEIVLAPVEVNLALADVDLVNKLVAEVKSGMYPVKEIAVSLLSVMHKSQCRLFTYDPDHRNDIRAEMANPAEARKYLTPVCVTVDSDGNLRTFADGSHRLDGAEHNDWVTIPAYLIPHEKFKNNPENITHFGTMMNNHRYKTKGNSTDDLKKRIAGIASYYPNIKKSSVAFKRIAINQLSDAWPQSSIEYQCNEYEKQEENQRLNINNNFIAYENSDRTHYANKLRFDSDEPCITEIQTVTKITGSGFGGIQVMMADAGVKKGIVLVHYKNYTDYTDRYKHISRVKNAIEFFNFKQNGFNIELKFLDPFTKGKIVGLSEA